MRQERRGKNGIVKNFIMASGWVVAIAVAALAFVQQQKMAELFAHVADNERLQTSLAETTAKVEALEQQRATLEAKVVQLEEGADAAGKELPKAVSEFNPAALLKGLMGAGKDAATGDGNAAKSEAPANPFAAMFEGEQGQNMIESSLGMAVDMQYGQLFDELGLDQERDTALREAISAHQRAAMEGGMAIMRGEIKPEEMKVPSEEDLMASVAEVLDAGELEKFTAYQEVLPEKMMRQQMEMQVGLFAGGLSEEARAVTVDILVENLLPAADPAQAPGSAEGMDQMQAGYENALVQLDEALSPEDAARVRRFIEQQQASIQMLSELMQKPEEAKPVAPAAP